MKKSELKKLTNEQLIEMLVKLSKLNNENMAFLKSNLFSDFNESFKIACKKIDEAFSCFELMSLKDAKQSLNDFKKLNSKDYLLIELCLYYIKSAYELEKTDWRFQENFYSAIERTYDIIFEIFKKDNSLKEKYVFKVKELIKQSNGGWGHKDYLEDKIWDFNQKA